VHRRPRLTAIAGCAAAALLAAACSGSGTGGPDVDAAPGGSDPACADVVQRAPTSVLEKGRVQVDVVGAAVWGDPPIVLRCGVTAPGPSADPCLNVNGVDWLYDDDGEDARFVSYGRRPAVEITVPGSYGREAAPAALVDLATAVSPLPASGRC
jgi:hypothetical protein